VSYKKSNPNVKPGKVTIKNSMKKYIKLFLLFFLSLIVGCKDKKSTSIEKNKEMEKIVHIDDKLKDGVNISKSFIDGLDFNKYKYNGEYIEQISISSLEDKTFREDFFKYLSNRNFDKNQYEQIFLSIIVSQNTTA
jgi:hypothetical protein